MKNPKRSTFRPQSGQPQTITPTRLEGVVGGYGMSDYHDRIAGSIFGGSPRPPRPLGNPPDTQVSGY